jgi:hypothetical protein
MVFSKYPQNLLKYSPELRVYLLLISDIVICFFFQYLGGLGLLVFRGLAITHFRHTTVGRTPLDEGPARRRNLYLTTHNTHKRQTSMPPAGFEPTIPASERPYTQALDRTATGICNIGLQNQIIYDTCNKCYIYFPNMFYKIVRTFYRKSLAECIHEAVQLKNLCLRNTRK